ncbi:MAG: cellulose 1,4-beta-cellobiosidase [Flavobacteriales bacterium]|jgi:cellulose 1,4-beta-cellobiosidase
MHHKNKTRHRLLSIGASLACLCSSASYAAVCEYVVDNEWNSGFVAQIKITNDDTTAINGWEVSWAYTGVDRRPSGWNANVSGSNPYIATGLSWNSLIQPGQTVAFGVQGSKGQAAAEVPAISGTVCSNITNLAPVAAASASPNTGDAPLSVDFDASATTDPDNSSSELTFTWDYGDGIGGTGIQSSHVYTVAGSYVATLTVSDGIAQDTTTVNVDVTETSGNLAPTAAATATPTAGSAPLVVQFDGSASVDPDAAPNPLKYSWDFGDGSSGTGALAQHTYNSAATYTATLTVSDGLLSDTATVQISATGNQAPIAAASADRVTGTAALLVQFDGSASNDPDAGPNTLSYSWAFDDGTSSTDQSPSHTFTLNGTYDVVLTVSDGDASSTDSIRVTVSDQHVRVDNPFRDVSYYVDPVWSAKALAEPGGDAIAGYNTAVWMDRIGAITDGIGLRGHLDEALAQNAGMFMFVVYDLPNRDCAALASSGELRIDENGFQRYQEEYIAPIAEILADPKYASLNIVAIIEVDSLPNLVTNLDVPDCAQANGAGGYRDGVRHALNQLSPIRNVYAYIDIAHSGWLGWDSNFGPAIDLIAEVVENSDAGWDSIAGFISNSANYTPTTEPFLPDPALVVGGSQEVRSSDFYEWNLQFDEKSYVQAWRLGMIERGAPSTIGMLIDTSRNGWGGVNRPEAVSTATNVNDYANESRVDGRFHRGNWCNQPGGIGFKPWADPYTGIDAFVWVKPPGESDGIADPNFEPDPNDPAKRHDPMCDPISNNTSDPTLGTGALPDAPHAGRWYSEHFQVLLDNAYPPATDPAGPPPPPPPPPSDCAGLDPANPLVIAAVGDRALVEFRCKAPIHVQFAVPIPRNLYVENTGGAYDVTVEHAGGSYIASGFFGSTSLPGVTSVIVTRNDEAQSVQLRFD